MLNMSTAVFHVPSGCRRRASRNFSAVDRRSSHLHWVTAADVREIADASVPSESPFRERRYLMR